jgi:hypothetical protein
MDPVSILSAVAATTGGAALVGAVHKIWGLGIGQARIEQTLTDHVRDERGKFEGFNRRFDNIDVELKARIPNGEMKAIVRRLGKIEGHLAQTKAARPARRKR